MSDYHRIVVRTPNWVGDAVMALPFLSSLRLNAPNSEICVVTPPFLTEFFSQVRPCDRVLALDESQGRHGLLAVWRNSSVLRPLEFDLGFCLPPSFGTALMMRLAGVKRRVGHSADRRGLLLTDKSPYLPDGQRPHRALGYLSLLNLIWQDAKIDRNLHYEPGIAARSAVDDLFREKGVLGSDRILALSPGAAQPNKLWRTESFAEVGRRWLDVKGGTVLLVGGVADKAVADAVSAGVRSDRVVNLCGAGSLPLAGEISKRADVFVGNDSGLSHLAAAVGTPVVTISGPGDPSEVEPFAQNVVTVKKSLFCSPCYSNTCYRKDHPLECQDLVSVDDVWEALHALPQRTRSSRSTS